MFDRTLNFQKFLTLSIIQNQMVGIFTCSDIRPWIFHWCYLNRTFSPVITTMQTCSKSPCQHISILSTWNLKGHGGFRCLENPFYPSVTLQVQLSASYIWLSKLCFCREPKSFVSRKFTATVAWPRSPSHKKQNAPSSSAQSLWNISPSHGCKLIMQQCFEVAQDKFVFAWKSWEWGRFTIPPEDQGRLPLYIRSVLCPANDWKCIFVAWV